MSGRASPVRTGLDRRYLPALGLAAAALALIGLGPWLAPNDPVALDIAARLAGPSWQAPLGRDHLGRCILSRLLVGAQWSLGLSLVISVIGLFTIATYANNLKRTRIDPEYLGGGESG